MSNGNNPPPLQGSHIVIRFKEFGSAIFEPELANVTVAQMDAAAAWLTWYGAKLRDAEMGKNKIVIPQNIPPNLKG